MPASFLNIEPIVKKGLCTQCGACAAACPQANIQITRDAHWRYFPRVLDATICSTRCHHICTDICAGLHEDASLWTVDPIVPANYEEWCLGKILGTWVGYATDKEVRLRGSSGGVVTALLTCLLETGHINGALVVGPYHMQSGEHDVRVARTRQEIEDAWGSKYYPMPLGQTFTQLFSSEQRLAVVLLGCHMRSLRLMERKFPRLKDSVVLRIGLICGYCSGFKAVTDQMAEWGLDDISGITTLNYRDGIWPGNLRITGENFDKQKIIYEFLQRLPFTTNHRCMICSDLMNETSDLTIGDAWLSELTGKKDDGWSALAVRTPHALEFLRLAQETRYLHIQEIEPATFARSQEKPMKYKKQALQVRLDFTRKFMGKTVPMHNIQQFREFMCPNPWNRLGNRLFLLTMGIYFKRDRLRRLLYRFLPRRWIGWYVRTLFMLIAHDGKKSVFKKLFSTAEPVLNSDA